MPLAGLYCLWFGVTEARCYDSAVRRLCALLVLAGALVAEQSQAVFWPNEVEALEKHLTRGGVSMRREAASRLLRLPRAVASRLALKALGDPDTLVRLAAADVSPNPIVHLGFSIYREGTMQV